MSGIGSVRVWIEFKIPEIILKIGIMGHFIKLGRIKHRYFEYVIASI